MSTGAIFSFALAPPALREALGPYAGPNAIFVRLRPGAARVAALHSLQAIVVRVRAAFDSPRFAALTGGQGRYGVAISLLSAQRPAEIVNYRSMGTMPVLLAGALAAGALAALALTLLASVRRRRRQLALLRVLASPGASWR